MIHRVKKLVLISIISLNIFPVSMQAHFSPAAIEAELITDVKVYVIGTLLAGVCGYLWYKEKQSLQIIEKLSSEVEILKASATSDAQNEDKNELKQDIKRLKKEFDKAFYDFTEDQKHMSEALEVLDTSTNTFQDSFLSLNDKKNQLDKDFNSISLKYNLLELVATRINALMDDTTDMYVELRYKLDDVRERNSYLKHQLNNIRRHNKHRKKRTLYFRKQNTLLKKQAEYYNTILNKLLSAGNATD